MTETQGDSGVDQTNGQRDDAAGTTELAFKFDLLRRVVTGVSMVALALACSVPLMVIRDMIESVAGQTTTIDANIVFSATASLSIACNMAQLLKTRHQRSELKRQRAYISHLESKLNVAKVN